nr:uncharacterized protein LOC111413546 [Onthophagus taurus]
MKNLKKLFANNHFVFKLCQFCLCCAGAFARKLYPFDLQTTIWSDNVAFAQYGYVFITGTLIIAYIILEDAGSSTRVIEICLLIIGAIHNKLACIFVLIEYFKHTDSIWSMRTGGDTEEIVWDLDQMDAALLVAICAFCCGGIMVVDCLLHIAKRNFAF